jgi:hypothetical protein
MIKTPDPALARARKAGVTIVASTGDDGNGGVTAAKGFDVVSGWGTIDASQFVPALGKAVH